MKLAVELTDEQLEAIARRAAELVLERTGEGAPAAEWLSVEEAAELLRCRTKRIYDLRSDGRLGKYSEGGRALVKRAELEALVVNERALSPAEAARRVA